jgi:hypothetical protein
MKNALAKILLVLLIGSSLALPIFSFAAQNQSGGAVSYSTPSLWPSGYWGPIVWCTGDYLTNTGTTQGNNQLTVNGGQPPACSNLCDLVGTFINAIYLLRSIAIFIAAPITVLVGGIMIMFAGANPGMLENGKKILTGAAIGLTIVLCSYLIVNTVLLALNVTQVGGFNGNPGVCAVSS